MLYFKSGCCYYPQSASSRSVAAAVLLLVELLHLRTHPYDAQSPCDKPLSFHGKHQQLAERDRAPTYDRKKEDMMAPRRYKSLKCMRPFLYSDIRVLAKACRYQADDRTLFPGKIVGAQL